MNMTDKQSDIINRRNSRKVRFEKKGEMTFAEAVACGLIEVGDEVECLKIEGKIMKRICETCAAYDKESE